MRTQAGSGRSTQIRSVVGWAGSGLTTACIQAYRDLLGQGVGSDRILLLVRTRPQAQRVMRQILALESPWIGALRVETILGFVAGRLREHWSQVRAQIPELPEQFEPLLLGKDLTQFLLAQRCQTCGRHGEIFKESGLKPYQIWDQLSSAAYISGSAGVGPEQVSPRLVAAWGDLDRPDRRQRLQGVSCCLERLRQTCLSLGAFDYGALYHLFHQTILPLEAFWQEIDHLIVDQVEEHPGVMLSMLEQGIGRWQSLFLAYTWGGGESFIGVPDRIYTFLQQHSQPEFLSRIHKGSAPQVRLADRIAAAVDPGWRCPMPLPEDPQPWALPPLLEGETQMEAVEQMVLEIEALGQRGVTLDQIAIIAPRLDPGLVLTVGERLGAQVLPMQPFPSLIKYPLVRALLTAVDLGYPQWQRFPTLSELRVMLSLLLDLDPVRAELLAADVLDPVGRRLRSQEAVRFPERIGFTAVQQYQIWVDWLDQVSQQELPLDQFLSQLYREIVAPFLTEATDQALVQTLIETARSFRQTLPQWSAWDCLQMIRSGQIPNRSAWDPDYEKFLVIAPPVAYVNQGLSADYQFWFDITSSLWSRTLWRPLYNPEVLTPEWDGRIFGEAEDLRSRARRLGRTLFNLCCRTRKGIFLVRSSFNFRGEENMEILDQKIVSAGLSELVM